MIKIKHTDMKKIIKSVIVVVMILSFPLLSLAQSPPHPNGGNAPGGGSNTPVGGGAPIDGGLTIMLLLGAAYGSKKIYHLKK
jgi:hypothetical protein